MSSYFSVRNPFYVSVPFRICMICFIMILFLTLGLLKKNLVSDELFNANVAAPSDVHVAIQKFKLSRIDEDINFLNGMKVISLKNQTHTDTRGLLMQPVLPQHEGKAGSLHFIKSFPYSPARGNVLFLLVIVPKAA